MCTRARPARCAGRWGSAPPRSGSCFTVAVPGCGRTWGPTWARRTDGAADHGTVVPQSSRPSGVSSGVAQGDSLEASSRTFCTSGSSSTSRLFASDSCSFFSGEASSAGAVPSGTSVAGSGACSLMVAPSCPGEGLTLDRGRLVVGTAGGAATAKPPTALAPYPQSRARNSVPDRENDRMSNFLSEPGQDLWLGPAPGLRQGLLIPA